jgi:serine/threonine protein kinase
MNSVVVSPEISSPINAHSPEQTVETEPKQTANGRLDPSRRDTLKHVNYNPSPTEPAVTTPTEEGADHLGLHDGYPDLQFLDCIKMSRHREVHRAVSKKYGPCIVKTTTSTPTQVEVELLRIEFDKLRMCSSANIVFAHDVYQHESSLGAALVTEECGLSLRSWAKNQPVPPPLETILDIGIQIAEGLDNLHRVARLIHSDINPNNVCYDEATKSARIIDLGAAHGLLEHFTTV